MRRFSARIAVLGLILLMAMACKEKQAKQPDAREKRLNEVRLKVNDLQAGVTALETQLGKIKDDEAQRMRDLTAIDASLEAMKTGVREVQVSLESVAKTEGAEKTGNRGWPWYVTLLLVVAIIVLFYLVFKRVTREEGEEEEEGADEGFVEESDMGTIRYPGSKSDSTKNKP